MATGHNKRLLFIDAVVWTAAHPAGDPRADVLRWYSRWFDSLPGVRFRRETAEGDLTAALAAGVEGVILSGSPRDAWNDDPVNEKLCDVVRTCGARSIPFLGVCYGHQILARAFGGVVGRHPGGLELGNTDVTLTPTGRASALFRGLPDRFDVLSSHADAVLELPPGAECLVTGGFTPIQGFRHGERLFGVQFHPETDPNTLRFLWEPRLELWRPRVTFELDAVLAGFRPTPDAPQILRNFVTHILS